MQETSIADNCYVIWLNVNLRACLHRPIFFSIEIIGMLTGLHICRFYQNLGIETLYKRFFVPFVTILPSSN